jgi:hypothetical protein
MAASGAVVDGAREEGAGGVGSRGRGLAREEGAGATSRVTNGARGGGVVTAGAPWRRVGRWGSDMTTKEIEWIWAPSMETYMESRVRTFPR